MNLMWIAGAGFFVVAVVSFISGNTSQGAVFVALGAVFTALANRRRDEDND